VGAPALTFLAPPSLGEADDTYTDTSTSVWPTSSSSRAAATPRPRNGSTKGGLRMTRGAREAATGMKIADADIQRCLDTPDDVSADPNTPSRTCFRRRNLTVVAGADGMVLRVTRRHR
jgi:hypothetical protein